MTHIAILHQHQDWYICYKPAGISFHQDDGQAGLCQILSLQLDEKIWPVHRLDKVTSGLIIFARSSEAAAHFQELFSQHQIEKYYLAISQQKPKKKQGWVKGIMEKARNGSWRLARPSSGERATAITQFVSQPLNDSRLAAASRLFVVKPHSGKSHQIRVALKSLASPILGDQRYKGSEADRCYLHAYGLKFDWHTESIEISQWPNTESDQAGSHWPILDDQEQSAEAGFIEQKPWSLFG